MAYIVAEYYIGPCNRYDGTGNTDKATLKLFLDKEIAILNILDEIEREEIVDRTYIDKVKLEARLTLSDKYGTMYNFEDTMMYTIEYSDFITQ